MMSVPHSVRSMWLSSYQSFIWNRAAAMRARLGLQVLKGDLIQCDGEAVTVCDSVEGCSASIFDVVLPLPGCSVIYPSHSVGETMHNWLRDDGVSTQAMAAAKLCGAYRKLVAAPLQQTIDVEWVRDTPSLDVALRFRLASGQFATMLLREVLHTDTDL
mmetsp:Transcript_45822/g.108113  ORF Transcript_45822/g.108113 Transcript_45822/m.108113 type:complete len:159 (+) Transcript_45822:96-572(+)